MCKVSEGENDNVFPFRVVMHMLDAPAINHPGDEASRCLDQTTSFQLAYRLATAPHRWSMELLDHQVGNTLAELTVQSSSVLCQDLESRPIKDNMSNDVLEMLASKPKQRVRKTTQRQTFRQKDALDFLDTETVPKPSKKMIIYARPTSEEPDLEPSTGLGVFSRPD